MSAREREPLLRLPLALHGSRGLHRDRFAVERFVRARAAGFFVAALRARLGFALVGFAAAGFAIGFAAGFALIAAGVSASV